MMSVKAFFKKEQCEQSAIDKYGRSEHLHNTLCNHRCSYIFETRLDHVKPSWNGEHFLINHRGFFLLILNSWGILCRGCLIQGLYTVEIFLSFRQLVEFLRCFLREPLLNKVDYKAQHLTKCYDEGLKVRMIKILIFITLGLILPLLDDGISCTGNYN